MNLVIAAASGSIITVTLTLLGLAFGTTADLLNVLQALGTLATAVSAAIAYRLYKSSIEGATKDARRVSSKEFLEESLLLLKRSYELFTGGEGAPPANDRVLWLSTARMIARFNSMRKLITESDHLVIVDEHEEYWRLQYYLLLDDSKEIFTTAYFMPEGQQYGGNVVARSAIAVVFDFAKWNPEVPDPLQSIDDKQLFANGAVPIDFHGVLGFLSGYEAYWAEVQALKDTAAAAADAS